VPNGPYPYERMGEQEEKGRRRKEKRKKRKKTAGRDK
jgi:hypothetical protein